MQRSAGCSGGLRYPDDGLSDAVLHIFLHGRRPLPGLRAVLVVFRLLLFDRLPADSVPHGVHLADDVAGRSEVRICLLLGAVEGPSEAVLDAWRRECHSRCIHGSCGITGLPAW